jgi:hypothetical protein
MSWCSSAHKFGEIDGLGGSLVRRARPAGAAPNLDVHITASSEAQQERIVELGTGG